MAFFDSAVEPVARANKGKVLVVGGLTGVYPGQPTKEAALFDPRYSEITSDCEDVVEMTRPNGLEQIGNARYLAAAPLTQNGNVVLIGGLTGSSRALRQIEVFVPPER